VEAETTGARKGVEDAEEVAQQEQKETKKSEHTRMMNREAEKKFLGIIVSIGDSMSDLARSDDGENRGNEVDEEAEQGLLSEDEQPSWVMGTITKSVQW
jgi:hypothetical protein